MTVMPAVGEWRRPADRNHLDAYFLEPEAESDSLD